MEISPQDLRYFHAIAQAGTLSRAADQLHIAQPSLTLALRRLEDVCGAPLCVRSRSGIKLTKAGERLLAESRDWLRTWSELPKLVRESHCELSGRLTIGCHPSVGTYALDGWLADFMRSNPELNISLAHGLSRHMTQAVIDLKVDVGIVVNPVQHPDLVIKRLARDEVTLWRSPQVKNEEVLICDPSLAQTQYILRKLPRHGFKFSRILETSSLEVVASLVRSGVGMGILPARVAGSRDSQLRAVAGGPKYHDEVALIYRTENRGIRAIQTLAAAIKFAT